MKRAPLSICIFTVLALCPVLVTAQTGTSATTTGADAKKPVSTLSSSDKQLVKSAGEAQVGLLHMSEFGKANGGSEATKELAKKVLDEVNTSWGELATAAKGAELPKTDQSAGEKRDFADLKKNGGAKGEKAYLKALEKEVKRAAATFVNGAKSASDEELKAYFAKFQPKLTALSTEVSTAESESGKKK